MQQVQQHLVLEIACCADSLPLALWVRIIDSLVVTYTRPAELRKESLALLIQVQKLYHHAMLV